MSVVMEHSLHRMVRVYVFEEESDFEDGRPTTRKGAYICTAEIDEND